MAGIAHVSNAARIVPTIGRPGNSIHNLQDHGAVACLGRIMGMGRLMALADGQARMLMENFGCL